MKASGGVYVYRTRKPGAVFGWPIVGRHFAYVGETTSFHHRHLQHTVGGGRYGHQAQPWADLDPVCVLRVPLPRWKWLLHLVETLFILLLWPVYNDRKNHWNPRRIPLQVAKAMRAVRDGHRRGHTFFRVVLGLRFLLMCATPAVALALWWVTR